MDVWHEGDVRYERVLNKPDYEKWVPAIGRKYVKPKASPSRTILVRHGLWYGAHARALQWSSLVIA